MNLCHVGKLSWVEPVSRVTVTMILSILNTPMVAKRSSYTIKTDSDKKETSKQVMLCLHNVHMLRRERGKRMETLIG